jgi:hypothetical protein
MQGKGRNIQSYTKGKPCTKGEREKTLHGGRGRAVEIARRGKRRTKVQQN